MKKEKLKLNESALVCAAQRGDQAALQKLLTHNWAWLRTIAYNVLHRTRDLDDVLQEIAIKVIRKIETLREPECFRPWLASIARREALRMRHQRSSTISIDDEQNPTVVPASPEDFVAQLEIQDQAEQILAAVERLPDKYREVFLLQHSQSLTYREIAEVLDVPLTTVQIRLVRARHMILDMLTPSDQQRTQEP